MCPDKKRPAENTCRIVKGLDAVWAHFCPSKPCLPLSIDGSVKGNRQGSLSRSITRRSDQNRKIKYCFFFAILPQLVKKVPSDFFDKLKRQPFGWRFCFIQYICIFIHLCAAQYRHSAQSKSHFPPFSHVPFVQIRLCIDFLCKNMLTFIHVRCIVATVRRNSSEIHVYIPIHGIGPYII